MFEGFKPTRKELRAIDDAWCAIDEVTRDSRLAYFTKEEKRGYGNRHDAVPMSAARGLMIQWTLRGIEKPDALLRDNFFIRPAAIWATGKGAELAHMGEASSEFVATLEAGKAAYDAAFARMLDADKAAPDAAMRNADRPVQSSVTGDRQ